MGYIQQIGFILNNLNNNNVKHISIQDYVSRLYKYFYCDENNFIYSLIYIDKYILENKEEDYDI